MTKTVMVALAEGFEEIEAASPIDVLRRAGFQLTTVGIIGREITGSHGLTFLADKTWEEVAESTPDVLIFPGGMPGSKNLGGHAGLNQMAGRVAKAGGYLAAICAAPAFTLGPWGLLSNHNATCYPGCESQFPSDVKYKKEAVVVDGHIITACGPGVAIEFALKLVEVLIDVETANKIRSQMQVQP